MSKLFDAVQVKEGKGRVEVEGVNRGDLPEFFKEMGFKVGAEIGVYKGDYTKILASTGIKIYGIDPWKAYGDYDKKQEKFQARQDELFGIATATLADSNVTLIRKTSMEAVSDFEDESLDFAYLDGHHGFKYIAEDIWEWSKKIKKGGILCGHDYGVLKERKPPNDAYTLHVRYVVDAYTEACGIKDWWVLGNTKKIEGVHQDQWRSWMWFIE